MSEEQPTTLVLVVGVRNEKNDTWDYAVVPLRNNDAEKLLEEGYDWLERYITHPRTYLFESAVMGVRALSLTKQCAHAIFIQELALRGMKKEKGAIVLIEMDRETKCFHLLTKKGERVKKV